ncbi:unnamed protein product [Cunninghamella blakesleeana]
MTSLFIRYNNNSNNSNNNNNNNNNNSSNSHSHNNSNSNHNSNNNSNSNSNKYHFILPLITSSPSSIRTMTSSNSMTHQLKHNYTWLVFKEEQWQPFDIGNQIRLEQTFSLDGTFVDICDSHFPGVKRVRVFPKNNYLSYLGVKYRLSRLLQPDPFYH